MTKWPSSSLNQLTWSLKTSIKWQISTKWGSSLKSSSTLRLYRKKSVKLKTSRSGLWVSSLKTCLKPPSTSSWKWSQLLKRDLKLPWLISWDFSSNTKLQPLISSTNIGKLSTSAFSNTFYVSTLRTQTTRSFTTIILSAWKCLVMFIKPSQA